MEYGHLEKSPRAGRRCWSRPPGRRDVHAPIRERPRGQRRAGSPCQSTAPKIGMRDGAACRAESLSGQPSGSPAEQTGRRTTSSSGTLRGRPRPSWISTPTCVTSGASPNPAWSVGGEGDGGAVLRRCAGSREGSLPAPSPGPGSTGCTASAELRAAGPGTRCRPTLLSRRSTAARTAARTGGGARPGGVQVPAMIRKMLARSRRRRRASPSGPQVDERLNVRSSETHGSRARHAAPVPDDACSA